jgi:hypothetical protein
VKLAGGDGAEPAQPAFVEPGLEGHKRERTGKEVALREPARRPAEPSRVCRVLDALGQRDEAEASGSNVSRTVRSCMGSAATTCSTRLPASRNAVMAASTSVWFSSTSTTLIDSPSGVSGAGSDGSLMTNTL